MFQAIRSSIQINITNYGVAVPDAILMNGKGPYGHPHSKAYESFTVTKGKVALVLLLNLLPYIQFLFIV